MSEKTHTIPLETAEMLQECMPHGDYKPVVDEYIDSGRWSSRSRVIIRRLDDDSLWALPYEQGLTENQECDLFADDPVTVYRVEEQQVTVTKYVQL